MAVKWEFWIVVCCFIVRVVVRMQGASPERTDEMPSLYILVRFQSRSSAGIGFLLLIRFDLGRFGSRLLETYTCLLASTT